MTVRICSGRSAAAVGVLLFVTATGAFAAGRADLCVQVTYEQTQKNVGINPDQDQARSHRRPVGWLPQFLQL